MAAQRVPPAPSVINSIFLVLTVGLVVNTVDAIGELFRDHRADVEKCGGALDQVEAVGHLLADAQGWPATADRGAARDIGWPPSKDAKDLKAAITKAAKEKAHLARSARVRRRKRAAQMKPPC